MLKWINPESDFSYVTGDSNQPYLNVSRHRLQCRFGKYMDIRTCTDVYESNAMKLVSFM